MVSFNYSPAPHEKIGKFLQEGRDFIDYAPAGYLFKDSRRIVAEAIAEYIANQRGYSIFDIFKGHKSLSTGRGSDDPEKDSIRYFD